MGDTRLFRLENMNNENYRKPLRWKKEPSKIDRNIAELLCRTYLKKKNFDGITTKTESITPSELQNYLDDLNADDIQQNFNNVSDNLRDFIHKMEEEGFIEIEHGNSISTENLYELAEKENEDKRQEFVKRLFELLAEIHRSGLVHRDIKIENLMFVTRNGKRVVVLNDWDASFILENNETEGCRYLAPLATPEYASPEQVSKKNERIGKHTDVWQAGMVAYYLYNNRKFPPQYGNIDFKNDTPNGLSIIRKRLIEVFNVLNKYDSVFTAPENGDENMKNLILCALRVNPEKRPTAQDIVDKINSISNQKKNRYKLPDERYKPKPISREEFQGRLKYEKENERNRKRKVAVLTILAVIATASVYNIMKDKPNVQQNQSSNSAMQAAYETAEMETQTNPPATALEITEYITETFVQTKTTLEIQTTQEAVEVSINENIEDLDFTPVETVAHIRREKGYYTGGLDEEGRFHGENCIFEMDNGNKYEGSYYHGTMCDDDCTFTYSNGNKYEGSVRNDEKNGKGTFTLIVADRGYQGIYNGMFVDGNFQGKGTFIYTNNDIFSGEFWQHEKWNGKMTYANGLEQIIEHNEPVD